MVNMPVNNDSLVKSMFDSYGTLRLLLALAHIAQERARACRPTHPLQAIVWDREAEALVICAKTVIESRPKTDLPEIVSEPE